LRQIRTLLFPLYNMTKINLIEGIKQKKHIERKKVLNQ